MERNSPDSPQDRKPDSVTCQVRSDGGGDGLFALTANPVIECVRASDGPVVRRVNQAFLDTFDVGDIAADMPLETVLGTVSATDENSGNSAAVLEHARQGTTGAETVYCQTRDGRKGFTVRTAFSEGPGYVTFTEILPDQRVSVLEYLVHSLRNPLEAAVLHTEITTDTGTVDHLETVVAAHERMEGIIDDAMTLANRGSIVEEMTPVDIAAIATDAWQTTATAAASLELSAPETLTADRRRLRVLFENLFGNAIRHGTSADISDEELVVTVGTMPGGFFVADNGQGIPPEDRAQVLDVGYTTDADGTGLGLAIVADIADAHGWTVSVTDSDTGGTRVEFSDITQSAE